MNKIFYYLLINIVQSAAFSISATEAPGTSSMLNKIGVPLLGISHSSDVTCPPNFIYTPISDLEQGKDKY